MPKPCSCSSYENAVQKGCTKLGVQVSHRMYELCSNQCPAERPCGEGLSERYRAMWNGEEVPAMPSCADKIAHQHPTQNSPLQSPGLVQKALSAGSAMIEWAKDGFKTRTEEEQSKVLEICKGCTHFEPSNETCRICGCSMGLKTRLASAHCPLNLW